jgi:polyhydroxyalkanoate synthesis regulator phasin
MTTRSKETNMKKRTTPKPKTPKAETPAGVAAAAVEKARDARDGILKLREELTVDNARKLAQDVGGRVAKETKRLRRDLAERASTLQQRVERERRSVMHRVDGAVKSALASLNIPTRGEIQRLTRRVEELSRKVDALRRR